jgi:hypothetical protein
VELSLARQHWSDGERRIRSVTDRARQAELLAQVDLVATALRRRIGQIFTLDELAAAYDDADHWARDLLDDAHPDGGPVSEPGTISDAAFHQYARGASDYHP